jgi:phenylacetate-CoA ligase
VVSPQVPQVVRRSRRQAFTASEAAVGSVPGAALVGRALIEPEHGWPGRAPDARPRPNAVPPFSSAGRTTRRTIQRCCLGRLPPGSRQDRRRTVHVWPVRALVVCSGSRPGRMRGSGGICWATCPAGPEAPIDYARLHARQLRRLLELAWARVPFYRRTYEEAGFHPDQFTSLDHLTRIPTTTKPQRLSVPEADLLACPERAGRLKRRMTSGSTGQPIAVLRSELELAVFHLAHWWAYRRTIGHRMRDRRVTIAALRHTQAQPWHRRLGIFPMEWIDIGVPIPEILGRLRASSPDILISLSSIAAAMAGQMTAADRTSIHPRVVVTWGDTITGDQREEISRAFRARVVDYYASNESDMTAIQCPETALYHLFEGMVVTEVVRDGQPVGEGEEGEVVITPLWRYAMPFIRYRQGDLATLGPRRCPCGAPVRTLAGIRGRVLDMIPVPGGGLVHPMHLIRHVVQDITWVRRYQFVQESPGVLRWLVESTERPDGDRLAAAAGALEALLSDKIEVRPELVDEIGAPGVGKYSPYLSLERQEAWRKTERP